MSQRLVTLKRLLVPALSLGLVLASTRAPRAMAIELAYAEPAAVAPFLNGKLVVTVSPASPIATSTFSATVQSQTNAGGTLFVTSNTGITLSLSAGTGPLNGTLTGTIPSGSNSFIFTGLSLTTAQAIATITATKSSGSDTLTAGAVTFAVLAGTAVALDINSGDVNSGSNPISGTGFSVKVTAEDALGNAANVTQATGVQLSAASGGGTFAGTVTGTIPLGQSSVTIPAIPGVTYTFSNSATTTQSGFVIGVARTSGDNLSSGFSQSLTVNSGAATKLVISSVNSGNNPTAGTAFTVVVQAQDANSNLTNVAATTSITLTKAAPTSGGVLGGTLTLSMTIGTSSVSFGNVTYTKAEGGVRIQAAGGSLASGTSGTFTVIPGAATKLVFSNPPTSTTGGLTLNSGSGGVVVQVQDANSNVVNDTRSIVMTIGTNPGGGTLSGTTTVAAVAGVATFSNLSINKNGNGYTLVATATFAVTSAAFNISVGPAGQLAITLINPSPATAGTSFAVTVQSQDLGGNVATVTTATNFTLVRVAGTGTVTGTTTGQIASSGSSVIVSGVRYDKAEGGVTLAATWTSGTPANLASVASAAFTVNAATASKLAVSSVNGGSNPVAGTAFSVIVQSQDQFGNAANVTAQTGLTLVKSAGSGSLSGTPDTTGIIPINQSSVTLTTIKYTKAESGVTLVALWNSGTPTLSDSAASAAFTVNPGAATKVVFFTAPANQTAAVAINSPGGIVVQVQDANNNVVTTDSSSVTLAIATNPPGNGVLSGTPTVAAAAGVATFTNVKIDKAGTGYTLTATDGALTSATSGTFNITPGSLSQLGITAVNAGANPTAGVAFAVTVQSQDAGGNPVIVTGPTSVSLSVPGFTGTLGGTLTGSIASGASTATGLTAVTYTKAESLTLTATKTGGPDTLAAGVSALFTVNPATATKLAVTSVNGGTNPSAVTPFPVVVQSQDPFGNASPVTAPTGVTLSLAAGTGPLGGTLTGSIANGASAVTFTGITDTKAEAVVQVKATRTSGDNLTVGTSAAFSVVPGAAAQLAFSAAPTTTLSATAINSPGGIVVQVQDANSNLVTSDTSSVTLAIGTNPGSGVLNPAAPTVAAVGGVATFTGVSINKIGTGYTLKATDGSLTLATSGTFNITLGPLVQLGISSVNGGINPTAGTAFAVAVQSQDAGGNPVSLPNDVGFTLGVGTGTGTLAGTLAGTIVSGANTTNMPGLTYTKAEGGVTLIATQTSGAVALTSGTPLVSVPSAPFTVISGLATKLAVTTINGGVLNPVETVAFPVVVQSQDANGNPANVVAATAFSLSRAAGTGSLGGVVTGTITAGTSAATVSGVTYSKGETGVMLAGTRTSGDTLSVGTSAAFTVNAFATPGAELIQNGDFAGGTTNWQVFQAPDIVSSVVSGEFQFFKANPTTTVSGVASVYQETNRALAASAPVLAQFDLGNSTTARKRISVVVADADMTDLAACTFELPAGAPMRTYKMFGHTTRLVTNASLRFYAEDGGADGGNYRLDNVSLKYVPSQSALWTVCVDPTRPAPGSTDSTTNLLQNGDFGTGTLAAWSVAGNVALQLTSGVLEFIRPTASTPAAAVFQGADVVSQSTGLAMTGGQIFTATIQLGNSSTVRKRVTLRLSEADLSDQTACTFWVPPSTGLLTYTMRGFASIAWTNATLAVYPETAGSETWIKFSNATLRRTGNYPVAGVECVEPVPGVTGGIAFPGGSYAGDAAMGGGAPIDTMDSHAPDWMGTGGFTLTPDASSLGSGAGWRAEAWTTGRATLAWAEPIDLTSATSARLSFQSSLSARATPSSSGEVQVSLDGVTWQTIAVVPRTDAWTEVDVDLGAFAGRMVYVRFVYDAVAPSDGGPPDVWRIDGVFVAIGGRPAHRIILNSSDSVARVATGWPFSVAGSKIQ